MLLDLWPWRASSGVRRLQTYLMQEESLENDRKKKEEHVRKEAERLVKVPDAPPKKPKVKPVPRVRDEEPIDEIVLPKFRPKPIRLQPSPIDVLPELMWLMRMELQVQITAAYPALPRLVKITQQVEAANDADIRLRLLLLAA